MSNQDVQAAPNLLTMRPSKNCDYEEINGRIVLLVPRKHNPFLLRLIPALKSRSHLRLHLDEIGTYTWQQIDGQNTVLDIADHLKAKFGETIEPAYPRLGLFINQMARRGLVLLRGDGLEEGKTEMTSAGGAEYDKI